MKITTKALAIQAMIAAGYAALTIVLAPISFGVIQFRISEALTILPFFSPVCVIGLTVGCLLSNIVGGFGMLDIVFGSLATLLAGLWTAKIRNRWLAPLPAVISNGIIVGTVITFSTTTPDAFWLSLLPISLQLMVEEAAVCFLLGLPLLTVIKKTKLDRYLR